jgi:hypothetical protein
LRQAVADIGLPMLEGGQRGGRRRLGLLGSSLEQVIACSIKGQRSLL